MSYFIIVKVEFVDIEPLRQLSQTWTNIWHSTERFLSWGITLLSSANSFSL